MKIPLPTGCNSNGGPLPHRRSPRPFFVIDEMLPRA